MERALRRRRRVALAALAGIAAGAFALGAAMSDGEAPAPDPASELSARQLAGERIVVGLRGTTIPADLRAAIAAGRIAGVVLFAENIPSRSVGRALVRRLQRIPRPAGLRDPLLVMTDQEGGLVKRVSGAPTASAAQMGARGAAFSARQGRLTAANLRDLGINVDLAPVLDVARPGGVIAETERGFGSTAARVAATAVPFARALQAGGVAATGKHFPGFGAAHENTDFAVERIPLPKSELRAVDEKPYAAFSEMGGEMVMLSTASYPAFSDRPAAFTLAIASGELRGRLGFQGVSITDALETAAVERFGGPVRGGLAAARAGVDLLLFTHLRPAEKTWSRLVTGLRSGEFGRAPSEAAANRVLALRAKLGL
jgi:beta-N-acetylhexosaminidase